MRKYIDSFGKEHDLDNQDTFNNYPDEHNILIKTMYEKIGYSIIYTTYFYPEFGKEKYGKLQINRINKLIKYFSENLMNNYTNTIWLKEQLFLFEDETENLC